MALMVLIGGPGSGATDMARRLAKRRRAAGQRVRIIAEDGCGPDDLDALQPRRPADLTGLADAEGLVAVDEELIVICSLAGVIGAAARAGGALERLIDAIAGRDGDTLVVAEPVGAPAPGESAGQLETRERLGRAISHLARLADASYAVIAGHAIELTGLPTDVGWPED